MTHQSLKHLVLLTLRTPAAAAQHILTLNLGREVLWTALVLAAVVNTFLMTFQSLLVPADEPQLIALPAPGVYFAMVVGFQTLLIYGLFLVGKWFQGVGTLNQVMSLLVWLQLLEVAAQIIVVALSLVMPPLAILVHTAGLVYGLYILVHFIDQAHQLKSMGRAAAVLCVTMVVLAVALSLFAALTGRN